MDDEAPLAAEFTPAGFWVRGGALCVDTLIQFLAIILIVPLDIPGQEALGPVIGLGYKTFFISRGGQTPGKMAAGIKVISLTGREIGLPRALGRAIMEYASALSLSIGYFIAGLPAKRALHDYAAGTRVVYLPGVTAGRKTAFTLLGAVMALVIVGALFLNYSGFGAFQKMQTRFAEGSTKTRLGALRSAISIHYSNKEGRYPASLNDVRDPQILGRIPETELPDHKPTSAWTAYGAEVCPSGGEIDPSRLKDTGGWGYVTDSKAPCWGTVFVDCAHKDQKGQFWARY